jgi:hypothetical protein
MTEQFQVSSEEFDALRADIVKLGLLLSVVLPVGLFGIAYVLRQSGIPGDDASMDPATLTMFTYGLCGVAIADLIIGKFLLTRALNPRTLRPKSMTFTEFSRTVRKAHLVPFNFAAAAMCYGFILHFLGATLEVVVFCLIVSLVGFMLFRPGRDRLQNLWNSVTDQAVPDALSE